MDEGRGRAGTAIEGYSRADSFSGWVPVAAGQRSTGRDCKPLTVPGGDGGGRLTYELTYKEEDGRTSHQLKDVESGCLGAKGPLVAMPDEVRSLEADDGRR